MSYKSLLVHLDVGQTNKAVLQVAAGLAARFEARVVGIAACQPQQLLCTSGYVCSDIIGADQEDMRTGLEAAELEFREAFRGHNRIEWRSTISYLPLHAYVAEEARGCDIVISGSIAGGLLQHWTRHASTGALVMQAGRPVLIVPKALGDVALDQVVVGWKDVRECRRAVIDALPLLQQAAHVTVVEIAADPEAAQKRVDDVGAWLKCHGITVACVAPRANGDDSDSLNNIARERTAGLIVAGAYGHSRLQEWAFGGVTRDLLYRPEMCALVSH